MGRSCDLLEPLSLATLSPMQISGYIAFFAAVVVSRMVNEKGFRTLNDDEKLRLIHGFSKMRAYSLIPLVVLIGGYWLLMRQTGIDVRILTFSYFGMLVGYILLKAIWTHKKLASLDLPSNYRRYFNISQSLSLLGLAWFFYTLFLTKLSKLA